MRNIAGLSNIVLMGFMGTGKTTVGRRLAQKLALGFVETDAQIEAVMGMSIPEIFAKLGEIRFRSEESLVVSKVAKLRNVVISTGGGAVLNPKNLRALGRTGVLITLEATPEVIAQRTSCTGSRPVLKKDNSLAAIAALLKEREFAYSQGDIRVDTSNLTVEEVVDLIVKRLEELGYGKGQS